MKFLRNHTLLILACILFGGFIVRLYGFDNSIADWHSWRQSETASVSRIFANEGINMLYPKMVNISNVQSGMDNPNGYFFVEFPIYNALQASLFMIFGFFTIEQWGRLISITASLGAGIFLYLLVSRHSNKELGLLSTFFYMFIPFNIYYGRTILPDMTMVMAYLGGIYFFDTWIQELTKQKHEKRKIINNFVLALFFTAVAFLLKPHAIFFIIPIIYLAFKHFGWKTFLQWHLWLYAILSVAPLLAWRTWISQFPEGIPANIWLLNGNGIRFRPAFFRWIFYERLTVLISGYFGIVLLGFGALRIKLLKEWKFFLSFLIGPVLYVSIVATGNVQHDYYQIPTIPAVAIFMAIGSYFLMKWSFKKFPIGKILVVLLIIGSFYMSWNIIKEYFNINNRSIIAAGKAVQQLTPKDALIVANYNGDTSLLYQMDRRGWASFQDPMPILIQKGADYLVLVNPSQQDKEQWEEEYKVVAFTEQYAIFDLHKK